MLPLGLLLEAAVLPFVERPMFALTDATIFGQAAASVLCNGKPALVQSGKLL